MSDRSSGSSAHSEGEPACFGVTVDLPQITRVQSQSPFCRRFTSKKIWKLACKRIEEGQRRKRRILRRWKLALISEDRAPTLSKPVPPGHRVNRKYPLHKFMSDLVDKHCQLHVNRVKAAALSNGSKSLKPEVMEQVYAIESHAESKKVELDLHFEDLDSKIGTPSIPQSLMDRLTNWIFEDPVITPEGNTYERVAIEDHLQENSTDPFTMNPLEITELIPNIAVQDAIDEFVDQYEWAIDFDSYSDIFFEYD